MPRRTRRGYDHRRPAPTFRQVEPQPMTYDEMAHDLVRRGLASPAILGFLRAPAPRRGRRWYD